jgi:hypothetical protein
MRLVDGGDQQEATLKGNEHQRATSKGDTQAATGNGDSVTFAFSVRTKVGLHGLTPRD